MRTTFIRGGEGFKDIWSLALEESKLSKYTFCLFKFGPCCY